MRRSRRRGRVTLNRPGDGVIANVTGIVQTPNSELVQVNYNKIVPESMEGRSIARRYGTC